MIENCMKYYERKFYLLGGSGRQGTVSWKRYKRKES